MSVIIDTSNLNGFCREIARQPAVGLKTWNVMIYEVAKILENCVRLTTRDRVDRIKKSVAFKNRTLPFPGETYGRHKPVIYVNKHGLIWFYDDAGPGNVGLAQGPRNKGKSKTFHPMTEFFRYGNPRWERYQAFLSELKNRQIDVRGVIGRAAQTWVQMAAAVGINLQNVPGYVSGAAPFKGRTKVHGTGSKRQTGSALLLEMVNQNQIFFGTMDGNRILQTSINGRYRYFQESMKRGVFDDVKQVAARYKGLKAA